MKKNALVIDGVEIELSKETVKNIKKNLGKDKGLDPELFEIDDDGSIQYDEEYITIAYNKEDFKGDIDNDDDVELMLLKSRNLPEGYKFKIEESEWNGTVLAIVKEE